MNTENEDKSSLVVKDDLLKEAQAQQNDTLEKLVQEEDPLKVKDLTYLFNLHQAKRSALRISAMNDVQDALVGQMIERLTKYPDNFDNRDISEWMRVIQGALKSDRENMVVDQTPTINVQQNNQININGSPEELSRESRAKITALIESIMNGSSEENEDDIIEGEVEESTPSDEDIE